MKYLIALILGILALIGGFFALNSYIYNEKQGETPEQAQDIVDTPSTLDLSGQGLTKVPDTAFNRLNLEVLDVSNNQIDGALQAEVRHLKRLRVLDLSDNNFTGVPAEVGQLAELEVLDLSNNPITGLPYELGNLKNLRVLDLRGTEYSIHDLEIIKEGLPEDVQIKTDS